MNIDSEYARRQATQLATFEVQAARARANRSQQAYRAQGDALATLDKALRTFSTTIREFKGDTRPVLANEAVFSQEGRATAQVGATASTGRYSFFVERLASAHQLALEGLTADGISTQGVLTLQQAGKSYSLDLTSVDRDGDGLNSPEELQQALATTLAGSGISTALVRADGKLSLVLSARESGAAQAVSLSIQGASGPLAAAVAAPRTLAEARDAQVRLGGEDGLLLTQPTNRFDGVVEGVSLTFTQVHRPGESPLQVTVRRDEKGTRERVQGFIDAFNTLLGSFDSLTASGGSDGSGRGPLAGDATVRSIENRLNGLLRSGFGGHSLVEYGVSADRNGKLMLDAKRLEKALTEQPQELDKLFREPGRLVDSLERSLTPYIGSTGQLKSRRDAIASNIRRMDGVFESLQRHYDTSYQRYLRQYTAMTQALASMQQTGGLFA
ncbi:flagellar filament capping protein FliD [Metapseudomonas otitidis]|uniref:flagellar filament capping protein FliD n=1 Tax=Metapseudomonas otitidis TaxID=319939 RepID=UPI00244ACF51|nr:MULTISPECIES: flagellar filament capping protein FliD [Pseudomonas]MDG9780067.1 flagellar filament capping protein FliD [Pseudomonas otitidis]MDL5591158.1 flagellar filament capping protein FliD [Bacillus subtilis]